MRVAMMGSGGVGGFFGGLLANAGHDVSFIARGAHLEAMRREGLAIERDGGETLRIRKVRAVEDPAELERADLVIISVKLWDTAAAARAVKPIVGPQTGVVSLQNGVVKDEILLREFAPAQVMGGVGYVATHIARPGVIRQTGTMQRVVVGEYDKRVSERARWLADALAGVGVKAEVSGDIRRAIWEKYVFLVALSATTTTTRLPLGAVRQNPRTRAFLLDVMREVVAVGRAHGVDLPQDFADTRLAFADTLPYDMTSSMHHDLERGNRLEVEWLSGGVVELGRKAGVPTPMNRAVCDILAPHAAGKGAKP